MLLYSKTMDEDECECSDEEDDDDTSARRYAAAVSMTSSAQDTSLLHRHHGGVGLPTAFDGLAASDLRGDLLDERAADRLDCRRPSLRSPSAAFERSVYQPFVYADGGAHGVENGLDSTTYF